MEIHYFEIPYRGGMVYVEPLGDIHVGSVATLYERLAERVEAIKKDKRRYWIGMGDYIDNIRPWRRGVVDKRWELSLLGDGENSTADWLRQWDMFVDIVKPIRHKCIGMLWGNHEWSSFEESEFRRYVSKDLGARFLGSRCMVRLRILGKDVKREDWTLFATHGTYGGKREGGLVNELKGLVRQYFANIYLYGHTHTKVQIHGLRVALYEQGNGKAGLRTEPYVAMTTGGFLNPFHLGTDTYYDKRVSDKEIRPGTLTVGIDPVREKVHVFE
ncbi:MAG: metallophosphoesterase [Nitrososphaerota archaeon]